MREFTGKTAVVTGAGSGIGRALALAFARQGMRLAVADLDHVGLEQTADLVRSDHPSTAMMVEVCDVSDVDEVTAFADAVFARF
jgi:NAD(P)-dependent dehydrogenase (short-subunit alcohol dehydrogenase family)